MSRGCTQGASLDVARASAEDAMGRTIAYLFAMHKAICRQVLTQRAILLLECLLFFKRA